MSPGDYAKFRGSWGRIVHVNETVVFLENWRGQLVATAPCEDIEEVKTDERMRRDDIPRKGRRLTDFKSYS
jgi:hypothetical protein